MFLKLWEKGYIARRNGFVNWDPVDKTVLANEQVDAEGHSWRSGALVEKRQLEQWYILTTKMSQELLSGLNDVEPQFPYQQLPNWPTLVKTLQSKWIGKSKGAEVTFGLQNSNKTISVFTTHLETIMGVSFIGLSCNHPLVLDLCKENPELQQFVCELFHFSLD